MGGSTVARGNQAQSNVAEFNELKVEHDLNFKEIVGISVRLLNVFGIILPEFNGSSEVVLYSLRATFFIGFLFVLIFFSELINLYQNVGNIRKMASASFLLLTHVVQLLKYCYIFKYQARVKALIETLNDSEFKAKSVKQFETLSSYIRTSKVITVIFLSACIATCGFWGVYPFTEESLMLPLAGWFPFDTENSPAYEVAFVYQIVAVTMNGLIIISIDTLMSGLIMAVCAQFNILNDSLKNIRQFSQVEMGSGRDNRNEISDDLQNIMNKRLVGCVIHHRYILKFAKELTFLFSNSILGQFIVSVIILCTTLFEMTLVPFASLKFVSLVLYQYCMLMEIFLLCYFGNEIILESSKLANFSYHCDWLDCSMEFKRNLLFFMTRSQLVLKLYAGGFFTLSLETFVNIIKSSWSYFAVLIQVNKEET